MPGLYYEQFEIGQLIRHGVSRTVTESDNSLFCAITHNNQPLHLDAEYASKTEFGQRVDKQYVHGFIRNGGFC